jgi:hypothetical protein
MVLFDCGGVPITAFWHILGDHLLSTLVVCVHLPEVLVQAFCLLLVIQAAFRFVVPLPISRLIFLNLLAGITLKREELRNNRIRL